MNYSNANGLIKRIWTDSSNYRNVDVKDLNLIIWHLPAEKQSGLKKIFKIIYNQPKKIESLKNNELTYFLGDQVSIPTAPINRAVKEYMKKELKNLKTLFGNFGNYIKKERI